MRAFSESHPVNRRGVKTTHIMEGLGIKRPGKLADRLRGCKALRRNRVTWPKSLVTYYLPLVLRRIAPIIIVVASAVAGAQPSPSPTPSPGPERSLLQGKVFE